MKSIADVIKTKGLKKDVRNTYEFQAYGNRIAEELGDPRHRALYIKLAKTEKRELLEQARMFVVGQENTSTKGRLFMWKLKELKKNKVEKPVVEAKV
uniref:Uncharacterized protein n=1 Tax=candidate division WWE3 bacterium TaxID=2053526 RepID=A0A7C4Y2S9_UNCKA